MATSKDFAEYILDQVGDERARTRAMFGEYALYYDEKVVALLCDNIVYVKQTESSEELLAENEQGHPYPGAKLAYIIEDEQIELPGFLRDVVQQVARDVPARKKKRNA
jgi:TfoX/Sxy family transcriptional regulator of competence genes